ncbi:unnamed protein product [Alopecurus aequalis]
MRGEANGGDPRLRGDEEGEEEPPPQQRGQEEQAARPSSGQQQPAALAPRNVGYVGKHRLSAAIQRLDQELQSLQDELDELETMESASAACQDKPGLSKVPKENLTRSFQSPVARRTPPGTDGFSACGAPAATNGGNPKAPIFPSFREVDTSCADHTAPKWCGPSMAWPWNMTRFS